MTRLQVGANFTVIGSKSNGADENKEIMAMLPGGLILEIKTPNGQTVGMLTASPKTYKSGSVGYYANGKITL